MTQPFELPVESFPNGAAHSATGAIDRFGYLPLPPQEAGAEIGGSDCPQRPGALMLAQ